MSLAPTIMKYQKLGKKSPISDTIERQIHATDYKF